MADPVFQLRVPVDPDYRPIATEVVTRYLALLGGSEPERQAFEAAFNRAVHELISSGRPVDGTAQIEVSCLNNGAGLELRLRCDGKSAVVRQARPGAAH